MGFRAKCWMEWIPLRLLWLVTRASAALLAFVTSIPIPHHHPPLIVIIKINNVTSPDTSLVTESTRHTQDPTYLLTQVSSIGPLLSSSALSSLTLLRQYFSSSYCIVSYHRQYYPGQDYYETSGSSFIFTFNVAIILSWITSKLSSTISWS